MTCTAIHWTLGGGILTWNSLILQILSCPAEKRLRLAGDNRLKSFGRGRGTPNTPKLQSSTKGWKRGPRAGQIYQVLHMDGTSNLLHSFFQPYFCSHPLPRPVTATPIKHVRDANQWLEWCWKKCSSFSWLGVQFKATTSRYSHTIYLTFLASPWQILPFCPFLKSELVCCGPLV